jgi:hypothetical protein
MNELAIAEYLINIKSLQRAMKMAGGDATLIVKQDNVDLKIHWRKICGVVNIAAFLAEKTDKYYADGGT